MKRVFSAADGIVVGFLRQILEDQGIGCLVKNEHLMGGLGEIPQTECWPELWVMSDDQYEPAKQVIESVLSAPTESQEAWMCMTCSEHLEAQFSHCWNCGSVRPQ